MSRTVRLRTMSQQAFKTKADQFVFFHMNPANFSQPFEHMKTSLTTGAPYANVDQGIWIDKQTGTPDVTEALRQPQGYDHYYAQYKYGKVLESKVQISFMADANTVTSERYFGGFTRLQDNIVGVPGIGDKYANITRQEIIDMVNVGMIPKRKLIVAATNHQGNPGQQFDFTYKQPLYKKHIDRLGVTSTSATTDWLATVGAAPVINPSVYFIVSDIGLPSTDEFLYFTITWIHTIQFSGLKAFDRSVL